MQKKTLSAIYAVIGSVLWGAAFSMQEIAGNYLPIFTFNSIRSVIGILAMLGVSEGIRLIKKDVSPAPKTDCKKLWLSGGLIGIFVFLAVNLQQTGINLCGPGKSGFLTALYIIFVPIFGLFFHRKPRPLLWICAFFSLIGVSLLCGTNFRNLTLAPEDLPLLGCAVFFAFQILFIDLLGGGLDGIQLSIVEFTVVAVLSGICALIFEFDTLSHFTFPENPWPLILSILYLGIFSTGIGYTLQILAQQGGEATSITILMSLESLFSPLFALIIIGERMTWTEYLGGAILLAAAIVSQLPAKKKA